MKAILMLDEMPKRCCDCHLVNSGTGPSDDWCCSGKQVRITTETGEHTVNKKIKLEDIDMVQSWCPLIEINDNIARLIEVAK